MELPHPFSCDVCGVHKGAGNHWFKVFIHPGAGRVSIATWDRAINPPMFHCCGEEHALRKAGELLSELKPTAAALPAE
jgi:hypothetical protein